MEIGSAEGAKFPEGIEGRPDNAGSGWAVPVVASRRRIVQQQAQSWTGFGQEVASTTAGRAGVESGRRN